MQVKQIKLHYFKPAKYTPLPKYTIMHTNYSEQHPLKLTEAKQPQKNLKNEFGTPLYSIFKIFNYTAK